MTPGAEQAVRLVDEIRAADARVAEAQAKVERAEELVRQAGAALDLAKQARARLQRELEKLVG